MGNPAEAYWIDSWIYSEGVGGSYTELDSYDGYYGAYEAYVDSTLYFNASPIYEAEEYEYDLAVAYVYGDSGPGLYEVTGDHQIAYYELGWVDVGDSYASFDDSGDGGGSCCGGSGAGPPMCEYSVYYGTDDYSGYYGGQFYAVLGTGTDSSCTVAGEGAYSGTATEAIEDIYSTCYDPTDDDTYLEPDIVNDYTWTIDGYGNTYGTTDHDYVDYDGDVVDYFQALIWNDMTSYSSCYIWLGFQAMSYNHAAPYQTNFVGIQIVDGDSGWAFRGIYGYGSIY